MRPTVSITPAILILLIATPLAAQSGWLPSDIREAMVEQLAENIRAVTPDSETSPEGVESQAREGIAGTAARIEALGVDRILELAPEFPVLRLPFSGQLHIDAIARFSICGFPLDAMYADETSAGGNARRIKAAAMSTAIALVKMYLRHHYLAVGASDDDARAFLSGEELGGIARHVSVSAELLQYTADRCGAPLNELVR